MQKTNKNKQLLVFVVALIGMLYCAPLMAKQQYHGEQGRHQYVNVGTPLSHVFTAKEHGGHNQNWTSIQTDNGMVYVGHTEGISRFDGENWLNINTPHKTPVRSISDWQSALYFGTTNDIVKLYTDSKGQLIYESLLPEKRENIGDFGQVWSTASNHHGVVMVSEQHTFFIRDNKVSIVPNAISSKHFIFSINNDFYYKPRHSSHIYKLITKQGNQRNNPQVDFVHEQTTLKLPANARVMEIMSNVQNQLIVVTETHGIFGQVDGVLQLLVPAEAFSGQVEEPSGRQSNDPHDNPHYVVQLYDAIQARDGYYYIASTYDGLFVLNQKLEVLRNYREQDNMDMNTVFSVNEDMQGNIWLTGIPNVLFIRPPHIISQYKAGNSSTEILSLQNTSKGIIASGNGTFVLRQAQHSLYTPQFVVLGSNTNSSVDLIEYKGRLIKSAWGGIVELLYDSTYFSKESSKTAASKMKENLIVSVDLGRKLAVSPQSHILIAGSTDGAFAISLKQNKWQVNPITGVTEPLISTFIDKDNNAWFGTPTAKLFKLSLENNRFAKTNIAKPPIVYTQENGLRAGAVELFNVKGELVISSGGQLLKPANEQLVPANLEMLPNAWLENTAYIDNLVYTKGTNGTSNKLWYRKDGRSGFFEQIDSQEWRESTFIFDSIEKGGFNDMFITDEHVLYFVRDKAEIYRVNIEVESTALPISPINITSMQSHNDLLDFKLDNNTPLVLQSTQDNLRFTYASNQTISLRPTQYRTSLNNEWSLWSTETYKDFSQLSADNYTLTVQAKDPWGRIVSTQVRFQVLSPWYKSTTAILSYCLFALLILFGFAYLVQKWQTQKLASMNKILEQKVEQRTVQVNEKVEQLKQQQVLKDRFFSNVSHEFRTPLTLTIGPLEVLMQDHGGQLNENVKSLANTALSNAKKMLALIGQVLDLNRLEAGKLPLRIAQHDVAELLRNIGQRFESWAKQHKQSISIVNCEEPFMLWFDIDQFDKCVSNLMSNAIKYSGDGSTIALHLWVPDDKSNTAQILLSDNGKGITRSAKEKVFERFFQDKSSEQVTEPGTGIGLSLVKEIMELHQGNVYLKDVEPPMPGCCFVLSLQRGNAHFDKQQIVEPIQLQEQLVQKVDIEPVKSDSTNLDITTLLVVDDNAELLNFISLRLSSTYRIIQANNGQKGLELAQKYLPDLVISDVNMPVMDGLALTQALKAAPQTNTIPIILLTAKVSKREVVQGFSVGADDYLTKPFDTSELIVRVNALIHARKLIRHSLQFAAPALDTNKATFIDKLHSILQANLCEPEFKVDTLASKLHISRDTLIRRCKKELGDTPANILRAARMRQSETLLMQNNLSISEIAYSCGFESLAYFSKTFKKHKGENPSEFVQRHAINNSNQS